MRPVSPTAEGDTVGVAITIPDINQALRSYAVDERDVVVVPIGFVCDHVEVLYDLDVEARGIAAALGLRLHRAPAVNDHPEFITMLADLVRAAA